jgi:GxxExxY protein
LSSASPNGSHCPVAATLDNVCVPHPLLKENKKEFYMSKEFMYSELSHIIIGSAFKVHTKLGSHLPEMCYQHALAIHLSGLGHAVSEQEVNSCASMRPLTLVHPWTSEFKVHYNDEYVGRFFTDIVVDRKIILELKSDERITPNHESQLFTYLRISGIHVGYILSRVGKRNLTLNLSQNRT